MTTLVKSESNKACTFITCTALPFMYGKVLNGIRCVMSDGGAALMKAWRSAITASIIGMGVVIQRICFWHAVDKRKIILSQKADDEMQYVADAIYYALRYFRRWATTHQALMAGFARCSKFIDNEEAAGRLKATQAGVLHDFLESVEGDATYLFPCCQRRGK